jgi:hypothetical protein
VSNPSSPNSENLHNRGWGFALSILFIALLINLWAFWLHKKTYLQPSAAATAHAEH